MLAAARKARRDLAADAVDRAARLRAAAAASDWDAVEAIKGEVYGGAGDGQELASEFLEDQGTGSVRSDSVDSSVPVDE